MQKQTFPIPQTKQALKTRGAPSTTGIWVKQMSERDTQLWGMPRPLWAIDNKMYDLTEFVAQHPGGKSWLELTKGQDITALFHTHHLEIDKVTPILEKYYVGECPTPRPSRFEFGHHFEAIRKRILSKFTVKQLQDCSVTTLRCTVLLLIWVTLLALTAYFQSYILAMLTGYIGLTHWGTGHLFSHRKDTLLLRHIFLLIGFSAEEQQIMHSISHHPYANTMLDYEYAAVEPIISFPRVFPKNRPLAPITFQITFLIISFASVLTKLIINPLVTKTRPSLQHAAIFLEVVFIYLICGSWVLSLKLFLVMVLTTGFFIGKVLLCPHRQPELWSQGAPEIRDFVLHNVASAKDFSHNATSFKSLLFYSGFNIHILHHLFPTIDHNKLPECNTIFMEYCKENGINVEINTLFQCNYSMLKLLIKKIPFDLKVFLTQ